MALIYPAIIRQQCQLRDAALEDTMGRLSIPKGSPATAPEGPAVLNVLGTQGWHLGASMPRGTAWQAHPRDGLCASPSYAPGVFQNRAALRPCASCCQEESLACADSFLSALKMLFDCKKKKKEINCVLWDWEHQEQKWQQKQCLLEPCCQAENTSAVPVCALAFS